MTRSEYHRNRRKKLVDAGLCIECREPSFGYGVRCEACATDHAKDVLASRHAIKPPKPVAPPPKKVDRVAQMMKLAEFLIPPSPVRVEDIHRRKETA